jgi:putative flippase GtrA
MKLPPVLREINVFALVGVTATACQVAVSLAAQRWLALGAIVASLVGYAAAVGVSYLGNSLFTFRRPALHGPQFARFATISLTGLAINLGTVWVCTHALGWPLWLAMVPVVLVVPASTFVMSKFWAFRTAAPEPAR